MATIRKGNRAGEQVRLHQWENNWFSVDYADGTHGIVGPTNLILTASEQVAWRAKPKP